MNEIANRYQISAQEAKKVGEIEFEREDEDEKILRMKKKVKMV